MSNQSVYPVDPMAAFFAAVTAVENGQVGEVELEFRREVEDNETVMTMAIRRASRPFPSYTTIRGQLDGNDE